MINFVHGKRDLWEMFGFTTAKEMFDEAEENEVLSAILVIYQFDLKQGAKQFAVKTQMLNALTGLHIVLPSEYFEYLTKSLSREEFLNLARGTKLIDEEF